MARDIVAYYRVSTQAQGFEGLGMVSQRRSVETYATEFGCEIIAAYSEVETGRKRTLRNRPELVKAIAHARRSRAILAIARLDRLSRNLFVTAQLLESGIEFVACDNPHANRLTIQLLAAMAEHEGRLISERCKAASLAAKARGVVFGTKGRYISPVDAKRWGQAGAQARRANTIEIYADLVPLILQLRYVPMSLSAIASHLNALGHTNRTGEPLTKYVVRGILDRAGFPTLTKVIPGLSAFTKESREAAGRALKLARTARDQQMFVFASPIARKMRDADAPYSGIARALNALGHRTSRGTLWSSSSVIRLLDRCGFDEAPQRRLRLASSAGARASAETARQRRVANAPRTALAKRQRANGRTYAEIARVLNRKGYRTARRTCWTESSVYALLKRERGR